MPNLIQLSQILQPEFSGYILDVMNGITGSGSPPSGINGQFQIKSGERFAASPLIQLGQKIGFGTNSPSYDFHIFEKNLGVKGTGYFDQIYIDGDVAVGRYELSVTGAYFAQQLSYQSGYNFNFYYPRSNPSGYVMGSQTGQFQPTGSYVFSSETGSFITSEQTGVFLTAQSTGFLSSSGWVNQNYYPRSNPSGYITGISSIVYRNMTGSFITSGQTGAFYPAVGNPSGYLTASDTGAFVNSVKFVGVPTTTGSPGTSGEVSFDWDYFYVCIEDGRWRRIGLYDW